MHPPDRNPDPLAKPQDFNCESSVFWWTFTDSVVHCLCPSGLDGATFLGSAAARSGACFARAPWVGTLCSSAPKTSLLTTFCLHLRPATLAFHSGGAFRAFSAPLVCSAFPFRFLRPSRSSQFIMWRCGFLAGARPVGLLDLSPARRQFMFTRVSRACAVWPRALCCGDPELRTPPGSAVLPARRKERPTPAPLSHRMALKRFLMSPGGECPSAFGGEGRRIPHRGFSLPAPPRTLALSSCTRNHPTC